LETSQVWPTFLHGKTTVFPPPFPKAKAFFRVLPPKGDRKLDKICPPLGEVLAGAEEDCSKNSPLEGWQASPDGVDQDTLRVYINPTQYFDKVPKVAWEFCIGGYQPAQTSLKDKKTDSSILRIYYIIKKLSSHAPKPII
jgi:hypothetical protein